MKIEDAFRRYLQKECMVSVVGDEYIEGILSEIGDGWILVINDDDSEFIISIANIIYLSAENED